MSESNSCELCGGVLIQEFRCHHTCFACEGEPICRGCMKVCTECDEISCVRRYECCMCDAEFDSVKSEAEDEDENEDEEKGSDDQPDV